MAKSNTKRILLIEDDRFLAEIYQEELVVTGGFSVTSVVTASEAFEAVRKARGKFDVAIIDMMVPYGFPSSNLPKGLTAGRPTGLSIAQFLKRRHPRMRLIGHSVLNDHSLLEWFNRYGHGYVCKSFGVTTLLDAAKRALTKKRPRRPNSFIVHGHDERALKALKTHLVKEWMFAEPTVLRERPNFGRTIIEKFEDEARNVDLVFVLLTPDDEAYSQKTPNDIRRRSRQNVIFELGYFFAKFQRRKGRVILLHKGPIELPSDVAGVVYIDISKSFRTGMDQLSKEIAEWLP